MKTLEFNRSKSPQLSKTIATFVVTDNYRRQLKTWLTELLANSMAKPMKQLNKIDIV